MRVLVTRPEPEASATAERLAAAGHVAMIDPMLVIEPIAGARIAEKAYQAVLVTSANALRALDVATTARLCAVAILAVGERTAQAAREAGFGAVSAAAGSGVDALVALAAAVCAPERGPLLYLAGAERAGALDADLRARGFSVDLVEVYRAVARSALLPHSAAALAAGEIDAVMLTSARTAEAFTAAVAAAGLSGRLAGVTAACLSPAIAEKITAAGFGRVVVARTARDSELVTALAG